MKAVSISRWAVALRAALMLGLVTFCPLVWATNDKAPATPEITLLNLYDAFGKPAEGLTQDFGFSALVRYKGKTILFDSGTDAGIFERNLRALGVKPQEIDVAIASHAHPDHISGFDYLLKVNPRVKLYLPSDFALGAPLEIPLAGPEPQVGQSLPEEQRYLGGKHQGTFTLTSSGRFLGANVEWVNKTRQVEEGITLVLTRAELMGTFSRYPPHEQQPQMVGMPELSLSLRTKEGEVVLVGCSHSGLEPILRATREAVGRPLKLVAGGFHLLLYARPYLEGWVKRVHDEYGVQQVAPAHCTGHLGVSLLRKKYNERYRFFGLGSKIEL